MVASMLKISIFKCDNLVGFLISSHIAMCIVLSLSYVANRLLYVRTRCYLLISTKITVSYKHLA